MTDNSEYDPFNPTEESKVYTPVPGTHAAARARRQLTRQAAEWTPEAEQELANLERLEALGRTNVTTRIGYLTESRDAAHQLGRTQAATDPEAAELERLSALPEASITPGLRLKMGHLAETIDARK